LRVRRAGHLCQELKGALGGAKVRKSQADVGVDHAHQGDIGNVVPLGDHLRSDQNVVAALAEAVKNALVEPLAGNAVTVHAGHARLGELAVQFLLHPLGADALEVDVLTLALRTKARNGGGVVAVVAEHALVAAVGRSA